MSEIRSLPCVLTDEELLKKGDESAKLTNEKNALKVEKKSVATEFKEKIDALETRVGELSIEIKNKKIVKQVECEWNDGGTKLVRTDTGEVVEEKAQKKMDI